LGLWVTACQHRRDLRRLLCGFLTAGLLTTPAACLDRRSYMPLRRRRLLACLPPPPWFLPRLYAAACCCLYTAAAC